MVARKAFENELNKLHNELIYFGGLVEESIENAIQALKTKNTELAKQIIRNDDKIDSVEKDIERQCLMIIATQQPLAKDLRTVSSILKLITDLERIGDHASDIADLTLRLSQSAFVKPLLDIPCMAAIAKLMLHDSITAYVDCNHALAGQVIEMDDQVDEYFSKITLELIALMKNDAGVVDQCIDFMLITKYLERIGDHATNIAEWAIYNISGEYADNVQKHIQDE